jgi:hypothetical protein
VTEFSLADRVERRVESPLQKFARLRAEVEELRGDLDVISKEDAESGEIILCFSCSISLTVTFHDLVL